MWQDRSALVGIDGLAFGMLAGFWLRLGLCLLWLAGCQGRLEALELGFPDRCCLVHQLKGFAMAVEPLSATPAVCRRNVEVLNSNPKTFVCPC